MSQPWKWIAVLAVVLPLGGYAAGLVVGSAEPVEDRPAIVFEQTSDDDPSTGPGHRPGDGQDGKDGKDGDPGRPTGLPTTLPQGGGETDDDDADDDERPKVVRPDPDRFDTRDDDDDRDDDRRGGRDRDDDDDDDDD